MMKIIMPTCSELPDSPKAWLGSVEPSAMPNSRIGKARKTAMSQLMTLSTQPPK